MRATSRFILKYPALAAAMVMSFAPAMVRANTPTPSRASALAVQSGPAPSVSISGSRLVDDSGNTMRLLGVNRSGTEYACIQGWGIFDGPSDAASIQAMAAWRINAVRVPLNEDCWLNLNGVPAAYGGANYQKAIADYVTLLNQSGLVAILDLHWTAPGSTPANRQLPMPDADHTPTFWSQVAAAYAANPSVVFDLFNEPFPDNNQDTAAAWTCVRDGGAACNGLLVDGGGATLTYTAAGMQSLVTAIRNAGAPNVIMAGGVTYSGSLSRWLSYQPSDPLNRVAASWHNYNFNSCITEACWSGTIAPVAAQVPVVTGEIAENDCATGYVNGLMNWLDGRGISFLAWTWDVWPCNGGPALITDYAGTPTAYGAGVRDHLLQIPSAVLPALSHAAYGGYTTAITIQNAGSLPTSVRISYFDQSGSPVGTGDSIANLPVNASWTVRQDNGHSFPGTGGDGAQAGSALVTSFQPIASFVNEFSPDPAADASSYSGVQVPAGVGPALTAPTIVNGAYGGYSTGIGLLNPGSGATDVTIAYRDGGGALIKTQTVTALAAHGYRALYSGDPALGLPSGFAGTATITSTAGQLLGAVINETGPGAQFSSYDAVPAGSLQLNAPVALNGAFGGYSAGMAIQNTSVNAGTVSVTYYDGAGAATTNSLPIPGNGYLGVYQGPGGGGPAPGAYTATISGTVPVAAVVNEVAPGGGSTQQATAYNTLAAGSSTLHLPLVENGGSDPWNTAEGIMNTGTSATTVTVSYFDGLTGAAVGVPQSQSLAAHAFWGLYQPTPGGLPVGNRSTAVVTTSAGGRAAVICNQSGPGTFMSYGAQ